jgi:hypothetical protein
MAEFMNCKSYLFLTYGRSITNMVKLVAYAFPPQPSYSSLNPGAAVYMSPAHADTHNQQRDEIEPHPPTRPQHPMTKKNTPTTAPTPTATPIISTDCTPAFNPYNYNRDGSSKEQSIRVEQD